jgi:hypothetical protein
MHEGGLMGADIYTYNFKGEQIAFFRDSYNTSSLFGIINETLQWEDKSKELSWWRSADETDEGHVKISTIQHLHDRLEEALVLLCDGRAWKRGYRSGAQLLMIEKDEELKRLVELLTQLRLAQVNGNYMIWSV